MPRIPIRAGRAAGAGRRRRPRRPAPGSLPMTAPAGRSPAGMRVLSRLSRTEYGPMESALRCGPEQAEYLGRAHEPREERSDHAGKDRVDGVAVRSQAGKVLQPEQVLVVSQRDHRAQPRAPRPGRPVGIDKQPRQVMCQVPAASCCREHGDPPEFLRPGQAAAKVVRQLRFQASMRQRPQVLDGQRVGVPGRGPGQDAVHDGGPVSVRRELHARLRQRERVRPGKAFRQLRGRAPRSMRRPRPAIRGSCRRRPCRAVRAAGSG